LIYDMGTQTKTQTNLITIIFITITITMTITTKTQTFMITTLKITALNKKILITTNIKK